MKKIITLMIMAFSFLGMKAAETPAFPGGEEAYNIYIAENMQYPETAKENGIEGVVTVVFVVKSDGTLTGLKIKRPLDPDLEDEALRLVKGMPKWIPADKGDAPAEADIEFKL